jgi:hypothetical protein
VLLGPAVLALAWPAVALAQDPVPDSARPHQASAQLFASHEPLPLTIEAPFTSMFKEREDDAKEFPGKVTVHSADRPSVALDVDIRTRGKARLSRQICQFPPLRPDFPRTRVESTVFAGQDRLKLVTHCQDGRGEYEQYVLQEYLVYRVLNLLTDLSFLVRLVRGTYVDTEAKRDTVTRYGFLIESDEMLGIRTGGGEPVHVPGVPPAWVDAEYLALVEVFQYLIGNPDWSAFAKAANEDTCCHNTIPIGAPAGPVFTVPYDFDITGIVNPRYADELFQPETRRLGITRVRDRVYRGLCVSAVYFPSVFAKFNERREAIYALYAGLPQLDFRVLKDTRGYLDAFYRTINDPKAVEREFHRRCRA